MEELKDALQLQQRENQEEKNKNNKLHAQVDSPVRSRNETEIRKNPAIRAN